MTSAAITELAAWFTTPFAELGRDPARDRDAVVLSWPAVPVELVRACGLRPVLACGDSEPTTLADARLEPDVFPQRLHQLVEAALCGRLAHIAGIVLPRISDSDYKCFLYLREFERRGIGGPLPPLVLFDLLQTTSALAAAHNLERTRELLDTLAQWSGMRPRPEEICVAIQQANNARAAARQLQALRIGVPRLAGSAALAANGAFWQAEPGLYTTLTSAASVAMRGQPGRPLPRVLLAGVPVDSPALHVAIEDCHATVVDEVGPFGHDAVREDIATDTDALTALATASAAMPTTPRSPVRAMRARIESALPHVDAVVVNLPADDATFGWDYPWLRDRLAQHGLPHIVVREAAAPGCMPDLDLVRLIGAAKSRPAVRHG